MIEHETPQMVSITGSVAAGMEVASYLLVRAPIGTEKADGTRAMVLRPYTPSHTTVGYKPSGRSDRTPAM